MGIIERIKRIRKDKVYIFQTSPHGDWYWHRKSGWNGNVLSDGGQGYGYLTQAHRAAKRSNPGARFFVDGVEVSDD